MALSLAEMRARIRATEESKNQKSSTKSDGLTYIHWNIPENSTATVRFLNDGNPKNEWFWVENQTIRLPFNGVIGRPDIKHIEVKVPCIEMYGREYKDACPVHRELRTWYKDESLKESANKYWKKRSYFYQGFVRQNPMVEDVTPENPIRRFNISSQIHTVIYSSLTDPEILELPTHYTKGLDFNIKKTVKAGPKSYNDYSTSNWSRRESALTEAEQAAIAQYGLFDLSSWLPKIPGEEELRIIFDMFNASVDGKPYDPERWGNYYKPWGLDVGTSGGSGVPDDTDRAPVVRSVAKPAAQESTPPWEDEAPAAASEPVRVQPPSKPTISSEKTQDLLAIIRSRQAAKAS